MKYSDMQKWYQNYFKKSCKIIWRLKNKHYLCIRNREIWLLLRAVKVLRQKLFRKKLPKNLVVRKIWFTFASAFASKMARREKGSWKFFEKSSSKIWWFEKFALPLQPLSHFKKWLSNKRLVLWFTGFILREKCSIYLSISF